MKSSVENMLREVGRIIERTERVDHHVPEDSALLGLAYDLAPKVIGLLREGESVLEEIAGAPELQDPEAESSDSVSLSLEDIGELISSEIAAQEIADLAFFARHEVHRCLVELVAASRQRNLGVVASSCEKGLLRLRRALLSVESAIAEFLGQPPPRRLDDDLEVSLEARKLYAYLRDEVAEAARTERSVSSRLRALVYRLVQLRDLKVYSLLRFDDRVQLRRLLSRILEWLHGEERDSGEGRHIWQEVVGFTEILSYISLREEVVLHDRKIVGQVTTYLYPPVGRGPSLVDDGTFDELEALLGLDEALDALLLRVDERAAEAWREPLERVRSRLGLTLR